MRSRLPKVLLLVSDGFWIMNWVLFPKFVLSSLYYCSLSIYSKSRISDIYTWLSDISWHLLFPQNHTTTCSQALDGITWNVPKMKHPPASLMKPHVNCVPFVNGNIRDYIKPVLDWHWIIILKKKITFKVFKPIQHAFSNLPDPQLRILAKIHHLVVSKVWDIVVLTFGQFT